MWYYRHERSDGRIHLLVYDGENAYDLTTVDEGIRTFRELAATADETDRTVDAIAGRLREDATCVDLDGAKQTTPVVPSEIWAAGVTYEISEQARETESTLPEIYLKAYKGNRPELFFKATPNRTVGPNDAVGIRGDSEWDVPEPELALVIYRGTIIGYTIGNDMSSRSIEGENPLYLPQAKVYSKCCALGPCVATSDSVEDPHDLEISMIINRNGTRMFKDETSTGNMKRTCEELVEYYTRHNAVPELSVLLTGTSIVPPDDFTLHEGDEIHITIDTIGTLSNHVTTV